MRWEELTGPDFAQAVKDVQGVCLLPVGVIERHGRHLPTGTDYFVGKAISEAAAAIEPAIVFPPFYFGQIHEAKHQPGTIAFPVRLIIDMLTAACDECARNGLKKIILVNAHGGNRQLLALFVQTLLETPRDYMAYVLDIEQRKPPRDDPQWSKMKADTLDGHGGEVETSELLHICPQLVKMDAMAPRHEGEPQQRWVDYPKGLYTAIDWYTAYPHHYQGYGASGSAEKGKFLVEYAAKAIAARVRQVKADQTLPATLAEFYSRMNKPTN